MDDTARPNDEMLPDAPDEEAAPLSAAETEEVAGSEAPEETPEADAEPAPEEPAPEAEEPPDVEAAQSSDARPAPEAEHPFVSAVAEEETPPEAEAPAAEEPLSLEAMMSELEAEDEGAEAPAETGDEEAAGEGGVEEAAEEEGAPESSTEGEAEGAEAAEEGEVTSWREAAAAETAAGEGPALVRQRLSTRLPFWIYGGVWVVFVGVMAYLMWPISSQPFVNAVFYSYFVLGCAALIVIGPILGLVVWAVTRAGESDAAKKGLVRAVALRTAGWMAVGVILMWLSLYVLDLHRIGVIR